MRASSRLLSQHGAVALLVVLLLAVLLGFLGFALNAGHATSVRGELQNASDAAALAAARELNGLASGVAAAHQMAAAFTALHATDTTLSVDIQQTSDVQFCKWDMAANAASNPAWCLGWGVDPTSAGSPDDPTMPQLLAANAVQVRDGREASRGNALPVWLSAFLGNTTTMNARSTATAVGGGPCETKCVVPLVMADCFLMSGSDLKCDQTLVFSNDHMDNVGLTGLTDNANTSNEVSILDATLSGTGCQNVSTGELISIQNGSNIGANQLYTRFKALEGRNVEIPVAHPSGCPSDPKFNQDYRVIGFASMIINYVGDNGNDLNCPDGKGPCLKVTLSCNLHTNDPKTGCLQFGLSTLTTRLVQ